MNIVANDITLASTVDCIDVAVGISRGNKISLKVCPPLTYEMRSRKFHVYRSTSEAPGVLRILKSLSGGVTFTLKRLDGKVCYHGHDLPGTIKVAPAIVARLQKFLRIATSNWNESETAGWQRSICIAMREDGQRHARNMVIK